MKKFVAARFVLQTLLLLALMGATTLAQAASCSVNVSVGGVSFSIYNPLLTDPNDSTAVVTVTCVGLLEVVNYSIDLSKGNSGNYATRQLKSGSQILNYNLYTATTRSVGQIWGDTTSSTVRKTGSFTFVVILTPTTQSEPFTIFGRIPAGQDVAPGSYSDSIVVTVTY